MRRSAVLGELAFVFGRLGIVGFGGPAAHVALMRDELVRRRRWLSEQEFLDLLGATNLIPGPNSTEMAIHVGHARAGWPGLIVAGSCFILPATLIVGALAWAYVRFGALPQAGALLYGVKPVIIAVVLQALWSLGRAAVKSTWLGVLGAAAVVATVAGANELVILGAAAVAAGAVHAASSRAARGGSVSGAALVLGPGVFIAGGAAGAAAAVAPVGLGMLFAVFLKAGAFLFGSGYVLLAFLRADLVTRLGWLSEPQLLDAIAVGQVTPGPLFTTATFVGYILAGFPGAVVATVGIFLPAFVYVAASAPLVPRLRRSALAGCVLDGVNVAALALMVVVTWQLGRSALVDPLTLVLAAVGAALLLGTRVNSAWLVLGGALVGLWVGV